MKNHKLIEIKNREALIEFEKKEKEKILMLHKFGIYLCISVNIILLFFVFAFIYQINFSKHQSKVLTEEIYNTSSVIEFQNKIIQHRIVNFFALLNNLQNLIIENLYNLDEIYSLLIEIGIVNPEKKRIYLCYKGTFDKDELYMISNYCKEKELILTIKTKKGERFGGFISNFTNTVNNSSYSKSLKTFLFNIDKYGIYKIFKVKNPDKAFYFNAQKEMIFGDEDLVIKNLWNNTKNSIYSKFPKNFGDNSNTLNDLIGKKSIIEIEEIEIISISK